MNISQTYKATPQFIITNVEKERESEEGYSSVWLITMLLLWYCDSAGYTQTTYVYNFSHCLQFHHCRTLCRHIGHTNLKRERELLSLKLSQMKNHNTDISTDKHPFIAVTSGILFWKHCWAPQISQFKIFLHA